jgi:hypothetical protein
LRLAALRAERDELYRIARSGTLTNEVTRTLVREIDLQESRFSAGQHCSRSGLRGHEAEFTVGEKLKKQRVAAPISCSSY